MGNRSVWIDSLQTFHPPYPFERVRLTKELSSMAVLRSWHGLHKGCQLLLSQNKALSPLCGITWSTTLAATVSPFNS